MTGKQRVMILVTVLTVVILAGNISRLRAAETRISIGVTETMETFNPYGDSVSLMYSVWCQVLGCLGTYDFDKGQHVGLLMERWEIKDPNIVQVFSSQLERLRAVPTRSGWVGSMVQFVSSQLKRLRGGGGEA